MRDWPADLVEIPSPQLSRLRHLDEQLWAQEISELRETGSPARTSSSGVYVPWLVVGHEARTSNAASTLSPVMVGRDREFAQLQGAWRMGGQMLVVRGRAGIGKSRLVREFANWVRDAGGTVLAGRCSPTAGDVPFRPLREALLAAARIGLAPSSRLTAFRPVLGSLVPEWSGEHAGGFDGGLMVLAEGVLRLMVEWSSLEAPALLAIEDVHWADRETLEVIEYLADHVSGHAALVVVTLRDDETGPGSELVSALRARRVVHHISLPPLDPAQSRFMLRECLSAAILLPELIDAVVTRSDGVPFFIEELLAAALGEANSRRLVPGSIAAAVDARLELLPESTARSSASRRCSGATSTGTSWRRRPGARRWRRSAGFARQPGRSSSTRTERDSGSATR